MYLFLLLVIPCFLVWFCISSEKYRLVEFIAPLAIGISAGIIYCLIKEFFVFTSHITTASFLENTGYLFMRDTFVPVVLIYGIFMAITCRSDDIKYRIDSFLPVMMSFYLVYIPYNTIGSELKHAMFLLFMKPLLFIAMIAIVQEFVDWGLKELLEKKDKTGIALFVPAIIAFFIPAALESMWYLQCNGFIVFVLCMVFIAGAVAEYILVYSKGDDCPFPSFSSLKKK